MQIVVAKVEIEVKDQVTLAEESELKGTSSYVTDYIP